MKSPPLSVREVCDAQIYKYSSKELSLIQYFFSKFSIFFCKQKLIRNRNLLKTQLVANLCAWNLALWCRDDGCILLLRREIAYQKYCGWAKASNRYFERYSSKRRVINQSCRHGRINSRTPWRRSNAKTGWLYLLCCGWFSQAMMRRAGNKEDTPSGAFMQFWL